MQRDRLERRSSTLARILREKHHPVPRLDALDGDGPSTAAGASVDSARFVLHSGFARKAHSGHGKKALPPAQREHLNVLTSIARGPGAHHGTAGNDSVTADHHS